MKHYKTHHLVEQKIKELPLRQRPREKLKENGPESLSDLELITLLVGSGTKSKPAFLLAQHILEKIDSLSSDIPLDVKHLLPIEGMGLAKATLICAALELGRRRLPVKKRQVVYPSDIYPLIRHYGNRMQEYFLSIPLNGAHEVISINVVSIGLVNQTLVHPREVFSDAIRERASALVVAHNHPSGILKPSKEDMGVTRRLLEASTLLGIKLLDHLIFTDENYMSMLEEDMLE
jgi:DNA repair protein RadC